MENDEILYRSFQAVARHIQQKDLAFADGFIMATYLYNKDNAKLLMEMIVKFRKETNTSTPLEELYISFFTQLTDSLKDL